MVDLAGVAEVVAGFVLIYSGYKNIPLQTELQSFLHGQVPASNPTGAIQLGISSSTAATNVAVNQTSAADSAIGQASGGAAPANTVTSIDNYGLARLVAGTYGWAGGSQWAALTNVIDRESGGNPLAQNASGAFGIAQALGHGDAATQGTLSDEYGGYGVPDSTAIAANSGNASAQLIWMMAYIKATYGTPEGAWQSEQTRGFY